MGFKKDDSCIIQESSFINPVEVFLWCLLYRVRFKVKEVFCPYFKEKVTFTHHGLKHLRYRGKENFRPIQDQYMRFKLLPLASEIVRMSNTLQGLLETKKFEKTRIHSRNEMILTSVIYYEFLAIINRNRVKIILKRIGGGKIFFWSIIPFWGMNRDTMSRILHDGLPEED